MPAGVRCIAVGCVGFSACGVQAAINLPTIILASVSSMRKSSLRPTVSFPPDHVSSCNGQGRLRKPSRQTTRKRRMRTGTDMERRITRARKLTLATQQDHVEPEQCRCITLHREPEHPTCRAAPAHEAGIGLRPPLVGNQEEQH